MKDHISVCVATYHRNRFLERLLKNIALQETGGLFDLSVVVVDNDFAGPARETVIRLERSLQLGIAYAIEADRTIPAARNHALRLARGNYIGIIDDDEFPPVHWLITLYRAILSFDVDGCLGPVHPFFEEEPPKWLLKSGFCERPVHRTGTLLHWGQTRTGNVLLKKDVFDGHNIRFNEEFRTGGSDREFFKEAMRAGCRFIAVAEAPVYELVPVERWKKSYYLRRALVNGGNSYRNHLSELRGLSRLIAPVKSLAALVVYAIALPFCFCLGTRAFMNCMERGAHHLSRLLALLGIVVVKNRDF
jgi:succinoglycan biosynthesis protein ExoM